MSPVSFERVPYRPSARSKPLESLTRENPTKTAHANFFIDPSILKSKDDRGLIELFASAQSAGRNP
jgi:hypothetical protein